MLANKPISARLKECQSQHAWHGCLLSVPISCRLVQHSKTSWPSHTNWSVQQATLLACNLNCESHSSQSLWILTLKHGNFPLYIEGGQIHHHTIQQLSQQQLRLMELFTERLSKPQQTGIEIMYTWRRRIDETFYYTDVKSTFPEWFAHYENLFTVDLKEQANDWKVRLLLRKLDLAEHNWYSNYILPKHTPDYNFTETVEILKQVFNECTSLFNILFNCLNITKCDTVNFMMYAGTINKEWEWFQISSIMDTQFKHLIFVCKLRSAGNAEVWMRILSKIEQNSDITCHQAQHIKSLHLFAGIVVASILLRSVRKQGHNEGFCTPPVHKITQTTT